MRTTIPLAAALSLILLTRLAAAQEDAAPPWEEWQPPEVQMPEPNAWEIYLLAGELEEQSRVRSGPGALAEGAFRASPPSIPPLPGAINDMAQAGRGGRNGNGRRHDACAAGIGKASPAFCANLSPVSTCSKSST
ncbi:MAG: hypothetical protein ACOCX2_14615 [Armatimonadota bacterium]